MTKARRKLYLGFGIYFIACIVYIASTVTQPIFDRLTPHVLGLPFCEFNVIAVQFLIAAGLCALYVIDGKLLKNEDEMRERGEKIDY